MYTTLLGLILFTDGVGGFATPTTMYTTINQLRTANISCWVVLSGGGALPSISLGSLPDAQGIAFLTEACNGCVIDPLKVFYMYVYVIYFIHINTNVLYLVYM